jgi:hypothetical protein
MRVTFFCSGLPIHQRILRIYYMSHSGNYLMGQIQVRWLCAALFALGAGTAGARDIYVAPSGNDSSAGSSTAPLKTLGAGAAAAQPGDTVLIAAGQYSESLIPVRSGTSSQPITFKKAGSGSVVIVAPSGGGHMTAIYINGVTDVVVDGIDANGGTPPPDARFASFVTVSNSTRVVVRNGNYVYANGWWGIGVADNSSYVTIENNQVDRVGEFKNPKTGASSGEGILAQYGNPTHVLVQHNRITHCGHDLLSLGSQFNIAQDNYLNNDWSDIQGAPAGYRNVVIVDSHNVFQRNYLSHSGPGHDALATTLLRVEGSKNIVRQNVLTNGYDMAFESNAGSWTANGSGNRIYNNTASQLGGPAWSEKLTEPGYTRGSDIFINNLAVNTRMSPPHYDNDIVFWMQADSNPPTSGSSVINNLIFTAGGKPSTILLGPKPGTVPLTDPGAAAAPFVFGNKVGLQPQFVAAPATGTNAAVVLASYKLRAGSPGVDQGAFLTTTTGSGNSATLPVKDASFFIDGFGIIAGDKVKLQGTAQAVQVTQVNYTANTLTLAQSVQFSAGQGVALDYQGSAPDIGASDMAGGVVPLPPSNVRASR